MHKKTPTMQDVARLAEVSIATVSAVINKTAVVSPKRAERVSKAMEALDYHPDHIARSLKRVGLKPSGSFSLMSRTPSIQR